MSRYLTQNLGKFDGDDACANWLPVQGVGVPFEIMRFRLTYDGELKAAGNTKRAKDKWAIRRAIHPQLADFWENDPVMKRARPGAVVPKDGGYFWIESGHFEERGPQEVDADNYVDLLEPITMDGHNFVPLIRSSLHLACSLDIVFMRRGEIGSLVSQDGDIDNRIKILFDGLRMPTQGEMRGEVPNEDPFYCLLEDDSLITGFKVDTDKLLSRPDASIHEVRLIIDVSVKVMRAGMYNMAFWAG